MTTRTDDLRSGVKQALLHNLIRIPLLLYVMTIIVPFVFMLINSFKSSREFYNNFWSLPSTFNFDNYLHAIETSG
ncbi:MAG: carbohydrate ABC transporter permease, partial [Clostridiales bacterium]|nr:carbohydrate ABC transporter permease [Clostridiales bacterium]